MDGSAWLERLGRIWYWMKFHYTQEVWSSGVLKMALCSFVDRHHTTWCCIPEGCTQLWFLSSQLCLIRCLRSTMLLYSFIAGPSFIFMYWTRSFCAIIRSASPSICCKSMKDSHLIKFIIFVLMQDCILFSNWKV